MATPKALILTGYGINCEEETAFAFEKAGAIADIIHINDVIDGIKNLLTYQIFAVPGGFSYGDDTGSGNALANRIKNNLTEELQHFIGKDTLTIGICNGCQVLANLGIIPGFSNNYQERLVAFTYNTSARYEDRWIHLKVEKTPCVFTQGIEHLFLPVAHGEGNFYTKPKILKKLNHQHQIPLRYIKPNGLPAHQEFPYNPNGALEDIAGITDPTGRIFALMPHPERHVFFTQRPDWTLLKEYYQRQGKKLPEQGEGITIFKNAVTYFTH